MAVYFLAATHFRCCCYFDCCVRIFLKCAYFRLSIAFVGTYCAPKDCLIQTKSQSYGLSKIRPFVGVRSKCKHPTPAFSKDCPLPAEVSELVQVYVRGITWLNNYDTYLFDIFDFVTESDHFVGTFLNKHLLAYFTGVYRCLDVDACFRAAVLILSSASVQSCNVI